jgi:hypothetical protein
MNALTIRWLTLAIHLSSDSLIALRQGDELIHVKKILYQHEKLAHHESMYD